MKSSVFLVSPPFFYLTFARMILLAFLFYTYDCVVSCTIKTLVMNFKRSTLLSKLRLTRLVASNLDPSMIEEIQNYSCFMCCYRYKTEL